MIKLFHLPNYWQKYIVLLFNIIMPIFFIITSFLVSLLPIQAFFPSHSTPDIPLIVLFCLLLHKYAHYFIPIFFLCVAIFEYSFMIPTASLFVHYGFFTLIIYLMWHHFLNQDISFNVIYFYFAVTYFLTLIWDILLFAFFYQGYLGFHNAFLLWISNIMVFPAVFFVLYYLMLNNKAFNRVHQA